MKKEKEILDYDCGEISMPFFIGYLKGFMTWKQSITIERWNEAMKEAKKYQKENAEKKA